MSGTTVQWRGGSTSQVNSFTGAAREVVIDTTKKTAVVQDGSTAGGFPLLREDMSNVTAATGRTALGLGNVATLTASTTASANASVQANASGVIDPSYLTQAPADFRNLIINGDMSQWQRGTTFNSIATSTYTADRFCFYYGGTGAGVFNVTQAADAPTIAQQLAAAPTLAPVAAVNSLKVTVATAATGVGAGSSMQVTQHIEGSNWSFLGFGAASAQSVTRSFWVKSSVTGTYSAAIRNYLSTRSYPATFTINSANTWERKVITFPGDTGGSWATGTAGAASIDITMHCGSTLQGTANTWNGGSYTGTSSNSNSFMTTLGATFQIALMQLEAGSVSTPFENLPAEVTLARCQRFYEVMGDHYYGISNAPSGNLRFTHFFKVAKRANPTVSATLSPSGSVIQSVVDSFTTEQAVTNPSTSANCSAATASAEL